MMEEKSPGLSESQEKEKLAVPLSRRKNILYAGADDLDKSREIKLEEIDPKKLLERLSSSGCQTPTRKIMLSLNFPMFFMTLLPGK